MKKYFIFASILLLAAGCAKTQPVVSVTPTPTPAISPTTGQAAGWQTYTDPKNGYSIKYPSDFTFTDNVNNLNSDQVNFVVCTYSSMVGCVFYTGNAYNNTNLDGAGVLVNIDKTLDTQSKCYTFNNPANEAQTQVADVTINGVDFKSAGGGGGAAGHFDKVQVYRSFYNNMCYEIAQDVTSSDIGNYPSGTVQPFDGNAVWQKLQGIVNTFTFIPPQSTSSAVTYTNTQYGFTFSLPEDWKGFTTYSKNWTGNPLAGSQYKSNITGPEIFIRNPNWTAQNPYEDIPVMVFTPAEWSEIQQEKLAVSAAPIPPSELGQNAKYVFALPPRFDYDYKTGYQEVEKIIQSNPLQGY